MTPSIGIRGMYHSNFLLTFAPHEATYGHWVSPAATFAGTTERFEFSGRVAADFVSYYGEEVNRFTNIFLPLTLRYQTEKDVFGFTGGFTRDNTLMSELLTTGVVLRFTQRNQWTATPTWSRSLTETLALQTSFQFTETTFENGRDFGLADYRLVGGSGGLVYQLTEQDQIQLSGSYVNFRTTNAPLPFRSSYPGVNLSLTHDFTETVTGTAYGGLMFVSSTNQTDSATIKSQDTVWLFGGSLAKQFESTAVQVNLSRNIVPSGFGMLFQTDRAGVTILHDLSETLSVSFNGSGFLASGITESSQGDTTPENRYFSATPTISWKFSEWWKLDLSYTYEHREVAGISETAMSHTTRFMLTYYPLKLSRSH